MPIHLMLDLFIYLLIQPSAKFIHAFPHATTHLSIPYSSIPNPPIHQPIQPSSPPARVIHTANQPPLHRPAFFHSTARTMQRSHFQNPSLKFRCFIHLPIDPFT